MTYVAETTQPWVFLSFAGDDRTAALCLRERLMCRGIHAFVDEVSVPLGADHLLVINNKLQESDYFVLLWSKSTVDRRFVAAEYSSALVRELRECRNHFFIVVLDETPLPQIMAPFKHIAAQADWDAVADKLATTWRRDGAVGLPVLPAPTPTAADTPTVRTYIRNQDLLVAHAIDAPVGATGADLMVLVRAALELKPAVALLSGQVGARFSYHLERNGRRVESLVAAVRADNEIIDLLVRVEWFGPHGPISDHTYRAGEHTELTPGMTHELIDSAFGHLVPRSAKRRRGPGSGAGRTWLGQD